MEKTALFFIAYFALILPAFTQVDVKNAYELLKAVKPGDTIIIKDGVYRDVQFKLANNGELGKPIVLRAETPGKVKLTGNSYVKIGGNFIEVNGFHFTDGYTTSSPVIEFRLNNEKLANNSRVTNCAIENYSKPDRFNTDSWIVFWGKNNRLDHCTIGDKLNGGTTLIVNLDDERSQQNYHSIDSNHFAGHSRLGSNGGETIRVGVSRYSLTASNTNIHHNYFEHCNGEVEIISIKSGSNIISKNTFYECEGSVVLRHGEKNIVEGNVFIGNNKPYTGGVRIINPGHKVYNNLFVDLAGVRFRSALAVVNGVPNSAINRYYQVTDAEIRNNSFINSTSIVFGAGKDAERTLSPQRVSFKNNFIQTAKNVLFEDANNDGGITFSNNVFSGPAVVRKGFIPGKASTKHSFQLGSISISIPTDGKNAGADLSQLSRMTKENTGAFWLDAKDETKPAQTTYKVGLNQSNELPEIIAKANAGDEIVLVDKGMYTITSPAIINKPITIRSATRNAELVSVSEKGLPAFFIIENGGSLKVDGIKFNSAYKSFGDVQSAITTTTKPMNRHYALVVDNCEFYNFNESNYSCIKATKSTYADSVRIRNSVFRNNSGGALDFAAEKEDKGIYNVEDLRVFNCVFSNNLSTAINVYRGGNDESTTGPTVAIDHCTFNEVDNREQGCVVKLIGVQTASVTNSIFFKSGAGGRSIWFEEMSWDDLVVDHCNFFQSGRVGSFYNKVLGKDIYNVNPQFVDAARYNFNLKPSSALRNKSSKGKPLGATIP